MKLIKELKCESKTAMQQPCCYVSFPFSFRPRHTHTYIPIHNSFTLIDPFLLPPPCTIPALSFCSLFFVSFAFIYFVQLRYTCTKSQFSFFFLFLPLDQQSHSFDSCRLLCTLIKLIYIAPSRNCSPLFSNRY